VVVSSANRCEYCVSHHAAALQAYWKDEVRVRAAIRDHATAEILNANMIAAYFNFVNRIAEGLGVDSSPEEVAGYRY
jgi:AhpD family alkylhydroperoxidase